VQGGSTHVHETCLLKSTWTSSYSAFSHPNTVLSEYPPSLILPTPLGGFCTIGLFFKSFWLIGGATVVSSSGQTVHCDNCIDEESTSRGNTVRAVRTGRSGISGKRMTMAKCQKTNSCGDRGQALGVSVRSTIL